MKTQSFLVSADIAVRMFILPDGKLVIETDYLGEIEVRQGPSHNASEESLRITGGCRVPSDWSLRNHTIDC